MIQFFNYGPEKHSWHNDFLYVESCLLGWPAMLSYGLHQRWLCFPHQRASVVGNQPAAHDVS